MLAHALVRDAADRIREPRHWTTRYLAVAPWMGAAVPIEPTAPEATAWCAAGTLMRSFGRTAALCHLERDSGQAAVILGAVLRALRQTGVAPYATMAGAIVLVNDYPHQDVAHRDVLRVLDMAAQFLEQDYEATPYRIVLRAAERIRDPASWTRNYLAVGGPLLEPVSPHHPSATRWCSVGAMLREAGPEYRTTDSLDPVIWQVAGATWPGRLAEYQDMRNWLMAVNDTAGRIPTAAVMTVLARRLEPTASLYNPTLCQHPVTAAIQDAMGVAGWSRHPAGGGWQPNSHRVASI